MNADRPGGGIGDKPLRIIVADDHEWIRQVLMEVVRQTLPEADIFETVDGLQALEVFRREGCDFLVSNHCMPRMDGMTLIQQVRKQMPDLPIVMVSIRAEAEKEAMAAGANWFLPKEQIMERLPALLLSQLKMLS